LRSNFQKVHIVGSDGMLDHFADISKMVVIGSGDEYFVETHEMFSIIEMDFVCRRGG